MRFITFLLLLIGLKANAALDIMPPYVQGTWTPIFFLTTSQPTTVTYSIQTGTYTKIGKTVCLFGNVQLSAYTAGSGAGNVLVSGTPFTTDTSGASGGGGPVHYKVNWATNGPDAVQTYTANGQALELLAFSAGGVSNLTRANMNTTTGVAISGCYTTNQ